MIYGVAVVAANFLLAWAAEAVCRRAQPDRHRREMPDCARRVTVIAPFVAAGVILACAEPFANSLMDAGTELAIDQFLLVQRLAPLASEAPAIIFASRGKGAAAIAMLISSKVNQWILLIGPLPIAYTVGGGGASLALDGRQVEEVLLTATQTMMGVALILTLRIGRYAAWALMVNRKHLLPTLRAPLVDQATVRGGPLHDHDHAPWPPRHTPAESRPDWPVSRISDGRVDASLRLGGGVQTDRPADD